MNTPESSLLPCEHAVVNTVFNSLDQELLAGFKCRLEDINLD